MIFLNRIIFGAERFAGKVINCLGDSITSDYSEDNSSWVQMIADSLPIKRINNYGIAGTTIAYDGDREDCFVNRFKDMDKDADVVMVYGGINDFNHSLPLGDPGSEDKSEFYGALNIICRTLVMDYPTADIFFITPMHAFGFKDYPHWNTENKSKLKLRAYRDAIINACGMYSIPVLDLYSMSGITPDIEENKTALLPDGLHPNKEGRCRLARKILNFMMYTL